MIEFRVKMEAPSAPNLREHHMVRARRVKSQRGAVQRKMPKWEDGPLLVVRLTRVAPRPLDGDNLQGAMKAIRDQVATGLRVDDRSSLVEWEYHQTKGEAEIVVQIWETGETDPSLPVGRPVERAPGLRKASTMKGKLKHDSNTKGREFYGQIGKHPEHSHHLLRPAYEPPRPNGMGMHLYDTDHPGPIKRAMQAAREAEETFAPAQLVPVLHVRRDDGFCTCGAGPEERCE